MSVIEIPTLYVSANTRSKKQVACKKIKNSRRDTPTLVEVNRRIFLKPPEVTEHSGHLVNEVKNLLSENFHLAFFNLNF